MDGQLALVLQRVLRLDQRPGGRRAPVGQSGQEEAQRRAARAGAEVFVGDKKVGTVTSGQPSPTLGHPVAIALLETSAELEPGAEVEVEIRGKRYPFEVTALPFYKRDK